MKKFILVSMMCWFSWLASAQEHVQWRGDNRDGKYPDTDLLKAWPDDGPALIWHYEGIGDGHASAVVAGDKVFTSGMLDGNGHVFAFDHQGKLLWKTKYGPSWTDNWNGVRSTPVYYKGNLYIMSAFGKLVSIKAENGSINWSIDLVDKYDGRNIRWGLTENLLIADGKLFVTLGGTDANVIALKPESGDLVWKCKGNGEKSAYNSPAIFSHGGRRILVTQTENSILGIDASDGTLLWSHEQTNEWSVHPNTPIYSDGRIYVVSGYGRGGVQLKLSGDGSSVTEVWRDGSLDNQMGGVVLLSNRLYGAGHNNRKLICLDWNTGKELFSTAEVQRGNTILADGLLYCYDERGKVALVRANPEGFDVISSFPVPYGANQHWAHLVIHDKRLYVRHGNALMVYDIAR